MRPARDPAGILQRPCYTLTIAAPLGRSQREAASNRLDFWEIAHVEELADAARRIEGRGTHSARARRQLARRPLCAWRLRSRQTVLRHLGPLGSRREPNP